MVFSFFQGRQVLAEILFTFFGYVSPVLNSVKAIISKDQDGMKEYVTYWVVLSSLLYLETALSTLQLSFSRKHYAPEFKVVFVLWLTLPRFQGAYRIYTVLLQPYFEKYEHDIDRKVEEIAGSVRKRASRQIRTIMWQLFLAPNDGLIGGIGNIGTMLSLSSMSDTSAALAMSAAAQLVAGSGYEVPSTSAQTGREDNSERAPLSTTSIPLPTLLQPPPPPADPVASVILTPTRTINLQKQLLADMIKILSGDGLCVFSGESKDILFPCQLTLTTNVVGPSEHGQIPCRKLNVTSVAGISGDDGSKSQWSASLDCSRIVNTELLYLEDQHDFEQDKESQVPLPAILVEFCDGESIHTRKIILREEEVEGGETQTLHLGLCALISDSKPPRTNKQRAPLATSISLLGVPVGVGARKSPSKETYKEKVSGNLFNCQDDDNSDDDNTTSEKGSPTPVKPKLKLKFNETPAPVSAFSFVPENHVAENKTEAARNTISTSLVLAEGELEGVANLEDDDTKENSFVHLLNS